MMTRICLVCQIENLDTARFCSGCGSAFKEEIENYDGFISYRRDVGSETARVLKWGIEKQGNKKIFLDVDELRTGRFDKKLLEVIEKSNNFIIVLAPGTLDRCSNEADWLYHELSHAIKCNINIIPVMKEGFVFPDIHTLPKDICHLPNINCVIYNHAQIDGVIRQILSFMTTSVKRNNLETSVASTEQISPEKFCDENSIVVCPICGSDTRKEDTFKCEGCGRGNICVKHRDKKSLLCLSCMEMRKRAEDLKKRIERSSKKFLFIKGGSFMMGSANYFNSEKPVHKVTLTDFYMMKYLVTQRDYEEIAGKTPSNFKGDPNRPVENLNWFDAIRFCNLWSERDELEPVYEIDGNLVSIDFNRNGYRLPTEAEWEYACRAGTASDYFWGDSDKEAGKYCWFDGNSEDVTHTVGIKPPNPWGLFDMAGSVWEWCNDWYVEDYYSRSEDNDPCGVEFGEYRVLRGGSWFNGQSRLRSSCRLKRLPNLTDDVTGFRCVCRKI
jgi:formylglycine-generating enzyme